jgi:hypothetical protein
LATSIHFLRLQSDVVLSMMVVLDVFDKDFREDFHKYKEKDSSLKGRETGKFFVKTGLVQVSWKRRVLCMNEAARSRVETKRQVLCQNEGRLQLARGSPL